MGLSVAGIGKGSTNFGMSAGSRGRLLGMATPCFQGTTKPLTEIALDLRNCLHVPIYFLLIMVGSILRAFEA